MPPLLCFKIVLKGREDKDAAIVSALENIKGGGEPRLKMVMKGTEFEEIDCSILSEFLTTFPRTAVHVPNPTFKVSVIDRRMLIYCSTFGAKE